ncbi:glycosyltransferase family 4 protein [Tenacibaculum sp. UWU-22]|uniref:glycosyltransferase family 4 protein n=1 Tax=Tenacibaculum sp. UWU-22 TaxID=3234187 RepID=UPI0034DABB6E
MAKIAIVVQRYGIEVNGGAEYHARVLAEKLNLRHQVTVLSTKALDYDAWKNEYTQDTEHINNIEVKRFSSLKKNHKRFRKARRKILLNQLHHKVLKKINLLAFAKKHLPYINPSKKNGASFVKEQGPQCPDLIKYIEANSSNYDCFIFFTYLYYPTYFGMKKVKEKAIFIPTAHDEPLLYTKPFENLFSVPKYIMYNTSSEKELITNHFSNVSSYNDVAGVGIEEFKVTENDITNKYKYDFEYFIYIGRIDHNKGCDELIHYFSNGNFNREIKLVLVGNNENFHTTNNTDNVIFTGFVDENTKYYLLENSKGLIIPSKYESLSLVTLESMLHKKIVVANKKCEVLRKHITNSKAGYVYDNQKSFEKSINKILNLTEKEYQKQAENGFLYVKNNYTWNPILDKFDQAINFIKAQ